MNGRCRTGEVIDLIGLKIDSDLISDVGIYELEVRMVDNLLYVSEISGHEVIDANDLMSFVDETVAQVGANKAASAGN